MKTKHLQSLLLTLALLATSHSGVAQTYSVSWFKIAGGGGTGTNGPYALSGTIGQHDAGLAMTNGPYSFQGGFWSFLSTPGSQPLLRILPAAPGQITLSWSPNSPAYRLQETRALTPTVAWSDSPSGTNNPITLSVTASGRFYRLVYP